MPYPSESPSSSFRSIATILTCAGLLLAGNGLFLTLFPLRADTEGFPVTLIGMFGTAYFGGFALGCFFGPKLITAFGHIQSFAGVAAITTALYLIFPLLPDPYVWGILRFLNGISLAVLFIVIESWLNDRSDNSNRGRVLSAYIIVSNLLTICGQLMINLYAVDDDRPFILVAILVCLAIVPLTLIRVTSPTPIPTTQLNIRKLYNISPVGIVGCFLVGAAEGAFWSLGPVFAQARSMNVSDIALLMSAFVLGGTISQWPLGWWSDRVDRRYVIAAIAFGAFCTGLVIGFVELPNEWTVFAIALAHGALMVPLYAMLLSHANDYAPKSQMVEISSGLLLAYSGGAALGPLAASQFMRSDQPSGLFVFIALMLLLLALFIGYRIAGTKTRTYRDRAGFVPVPKTTTVVFSLEEDDEEPDS
ncbi:MAG: MFS transporter [Rhodobacteraceae bacterium]|nr:MFS transporter [Paracoccaceae bacterium]